MGCSTSSRVIVEELSSKNPHHSKEAKQQIKRDASFRTHDIISQGASGVEDGSCTERLTEDIAQQLPSGKEENDEQNTDMKDGLHKKPVSLTEGNRQASSDILEELRMLGIIKTPSAPSQHSIADDTRAINQNMLTNLQSLGHSLF